MNGTRAVANLIIQLVARAERRVEGIVAPELFRPTLPAWRRAKERATLALRVAGEAPTEAESLVSGSVRPDLPTVLLIDETQVVVTAGSGETVAGLWSSHPTMTGLARALLQSLT